MRVREREREPGRASARGTRRQRTHTGCRILVNYKYVGEDRDLEAHRQAYAQGGGVPTSDQFRALLRPVGPVSRL